MSGLPMQLKILVIHQSEEVPWSYIQNFLTSRNCQVEVADSLEGGREIISNLQLDAVIFDLNSSQIHDGHLFRFMRDHNLTVPCILVGDASQRCIIEKELGCLIYDYLMQPVSDFDLAKVTRNIAHQQLILDENRALRKRLEIFESHLDQFFTKLENKVKSNTQRIAEKSWIWQGILNQAEVGVAVVDTNFRIIQANSYFSQIAGRPAEGIIGENYSKIMAQPADCPDCPGFKAMKTGKPVNMEKILMKGKDQPRYIRQTVFPIQGNMNKPWGFVEYNQDITEEKIEGDRRIQREKIKILEKLAALFSHYLLTSNPPVQGVLHKEKNEGNSLINIEHPMIPIPIEDYVADLFLMINQEYGHIASVDINALIKAITKKIKSSEKYENMKISLTFEKNLPLIRVNWPHLTRALIHLLDNSFDSMNGDGELKITTRHKNHEVEIILSDHGKGIPENIRYKIFEPFFTTKTHKLGLGLNICKSILERYKGRLKYHDHCNQPGQTTVFIITLPINFDCQSCHR